MLKGTNLTGGDTLWSNHPVTGPVSGQHYLFVTNEDIDYCVSKGMDVFRLVFGWEAIQPKPWQVPTANTGYWKIYWDKFHALVERITKFHKKVCIVDVHGGPESTFGSYKGVSIGGVFAGIPVKDLFLNLWWNLGNIYKDNPLVWFGIMNEPINIPPSVWWPCAQEVINKIRSTGATNHITMPGLDFSGAGTWTQYNNGAEWIQYGIKDPADNLSCQVHMYLDPNQGGGTDDIVSKTIGVERLKPTVDWCRANKVKCFLGEIGFDGMNPLAKAAWAELDPYMNSCSDVLLGWTWWAFGSRDWWTWYRFSLDPQNGQDSPEMNVIEGSFVTAPPPVVVDNTAALTARITQLEAELVKWQAAVSSSSQKLASVSADYAELITVLQEIVGTAEAALA